jgi:hypothetical protein
MKNFLGVFLIGFILTSCKSYPNPESVFYYSSTKSWITNTIIQKKNFNLHYLYWSNKADEIVMYNTDNIDVCNSFLNTNDCQIIRVYNIEDVKLENIEFYVNNYPYKDPSKYKVENNNSNNNSWNDENTEILKKLERAENRRIRKRQIETACNFLGTC